MSGPSDAPAIPRVQQRRNRRLEQLRTAERRVPVSFSVVGVQKAATSTLYMMLARHPWIAGGPEKEIRFFMMEDQDWEHPDYSDYARPANRPRVRIAGDATPEYLFWPRALERMHRYNPDMRLVATFRDPIERAFSQWSMQRNRDPEFPDLPTAIEQWASPTVPTDVPAGLSPYELRRQSLFTRGLYGQQLRRGLEIFPREQWLPIEFSDIYKAQTATLDRVTDFLGVRRFPTYPELLHYNQTPSDHVGEPPTVDDVKRLVDLYADDLAELERLSGLDVSRWSTSRVLAGEMSVEELTAKLVRKVGLTATAG